MNGVKDPLKYFRVEAREISQELGRGVLQLEKGLAAGLVAHLLRLAHTLKGAAAVVKQQGIAEQTHALEDALEPIRDQAGAVTKEKFEEILTYVDAISTQIAALEPRASHSSSQPQHVVIDETPNVLSSDSAEMDALLETISKASVRVGAMRRTIDLAEQARRLADRLADQVTVVAAGHIPPAAAEPTSSEVRALFGELRSVVTNLEQVLNGGIDAAEREMQQAQAAAEKLRLLPCSVVLSSLERAIRDVAHALGKHVIFEVKGANVRLDAQVLGPVQRALLQLVRNAVVHGIESGDERAKANKPQTGRVEIEVAQRGNRVAFVCRDDGRGVDLEAVRRVARERGLSSPQVQLSEPDALLHLLLKGGLTTSGVVTELSGRGVGLDIVREIATRLGGVVSAHTKPGYGTDIELVVPVSLSSLDALLVEVEGAVSAIPLDAVLGTMRLSTNDVTRTADGDSIAHNGRIIPFVALARALHTRTTSEPIASAKSAVLVEGATAQVAIGVDRLLGAANIVVRPLPLLASADDAVAGVSLDAEGIPRLVLDPEALIAVALRAVGPALAPDVEPVAPILVIDDSLTTRLLEQSILESAGYKVELAISAEEGLEKAKQRRYGLFLVDVEMPGMDGFTFIETTHADPDLCKIPAILVTSRGSREDQQRGIAVGARAYVVKGEFDQGRFLQTVRQLLART